MKEQVNNQNTFAIAELEQRLEMQQCPAGTIDVLSWIPGGVGELVQGFVCYRTCV